jgi:hypothetical protein
MSAMRRAALIAVVVAACSAAMVALVAAPVDRAEFFGERPAKRIQAEATPKPTAEPTEAPVAHAPRVASERPVAPAVTSRPGPTPIIAIIDEHNNVDTSDDSDANTDDHTASGE